MQIGQVIKIAHNAERSSLCVSQVQVVVKLADEAVHEVAALRCRDPQAIPLPADYA